jgi:hypothetical protein
VYKSYAVVSFIPFFLSVHEDVTPRGVNPPLQLLLPLNLNIDESCVAELAQVLAEAPICPPSRRTCPSVIVPPARAVLIMAVMLLYGTVHLQHTRQHRKLLG